MNIAMTEDLVQFVREQVETRYFDSASDYVRSLIREDKRRWVPVRTAPPRRANDCMISREHAKAVVEMYEGSGS